MHAKTQNVNINRILASYPCDKFEPFKKKDAKYSFKSSSPKGPNEDDL